MVVRAQPLLRLAQLAQHGLRGLDGLVLGNFCCHGRCHLSVRTWPFLTRLPFGGCVRETRVKTRKHLKKEVVAPTGSDHACTRLLRFQLTGLAVA